jgi:hypothetical protein
MATNPDAPKVGYRRGLNDITSHMAINRPLDLLMRSSEDEDRKQEDDIGNNDDEDRKIEEPFQRPPRDERQAVSMMNDGSITENIGMFNGHTENRPLKIDLRQGGQN